MERAGKALAKLKLSEAISPDQLAFAAWPAAVGERIAAHVWPKALVRGRLILEAEDGVWQKHLLHLSPQVLGKISELLGSGIVTDLAFSTPSAAPRRPPQPAASHGKSASSDEADRIEDPGMRIVYKQARAMALGKGAKKASA
jgi:predicted nucleic acid-binding Zn ribbon protein